MKLDFKRALSRNHLKDSFLDLVQDTENRFADFFDKLRRERQEYIDQSGWRTDEKTNPESSKTLTAREGFGPNKLPLIIFSDGTSYADIAKIPKESGYWNAHALLEKAGNARIVTLYKPDGTTFETVELNFRYTNKRTAAQSGSLAAVPG